MQGMIPDMTHVFGSGRTATLPRMEQVRLCRLIRFVKIVEYAERLCGCPQSLRVVHGAAILLDDF